MQLEICGYFIKKMWVVWKIKHTKQNLCSVYLMTSLQWSEIASNGLKNRIICHVSLWSKWHTSLLFSKYDVFFTNIMIIISWRFKFRMQICKVNLSQCMPWKHTGEAVEGPSKGVQSWLCPRISLDILKKHKIYCLLGIKPCTWYNSV
jgi:hypothetical protein